MNYTTINTSVSGGYLVPDVIRVNKKGLLAKIARFFNHSYGWEDFKLKEEIENYFKKQRDKMEQEILFGTSGKSPTGFIRDDAKEIRDNILNINTLT